MIILLSPAKAMNEKDRLVPQSTPVFLEKSSQLAKELSKLSAEDVSRLMKLSPELGRLNAKRFSAWKPLEIETARAGAQNKSSLQHGSGVFAAAALFDGPAFRGLSFSTLDAASQKHAQKTLRILSGLYGILRPLDGILPYRLEMGTSLAPLQKEGLLKKLPKNLYEFWGMDIADVLANELEKKNTKNNKEKPLLVNLASKEYAKAARLPELEASILSPVFLDRTKNGQYKTLMAYAKRARGLMARFLIESRAKTPADILKFDSEGYRYDSERSKEDSPVFVRDMA